MFSFSNIKQITGVTSILFYDNPDKPIFVAAWRGDQSNDSIDWRITRTYPNGVVGSTGFSLEDIRGCTYVVPVISVNRGGSLKPFVVTRGYERVRSSCTSNTCDVLNCFDFSGPIDGVGKFGEEWVNYWNGTRGATSFYQKYIMSYDIEPGITSSIYVRRGSTNLLGSSNRWKHSSSLSTLPWDNNGDRYTITDGYTDPDGTTKASLLEFNSKGYGALRQKVPIIAGQTYTFSYWIKTGGESGNPNTPLFFNHRFVNNTDPGINIDIESPPILATTAWQRTSAQFYTDNSGVFHIYPYIAPRNGNTGDKFYVYNAQFEAGSTFTNYVDNPTATEPQYYPSTLERIQTIENILGISLDGKLVLDPFRYHYRDSIFGASADNILSDGSPANYGIWQSVFRGCCGNLQGLTVWPSLWPDSGIEALKADWSVWLNEFSNSGRKIDYLQFDNEGDNPADSYNIKALNAFPSSLGLSAGSEFLRGLTSSSKWYSSWRGLPSFAQLTSTFDITKILQSERCATCNFEYVKWNNITSMYGTHALNEAIWKPFKEKYPLAKGANYDNVLQDADNPGPDYNGHPQYYSKYFGTSSSPVIYGTIEQAATSWYVSKSDSTRLTYDTTGYSYNDPGDRLINNYWGAFQLDQQHLRACVRRFKNGLLQPWIAGISYGSPDSLLATYTSGESKYPEDARYYYENIRHAALMRTELFLYWNPSNGPDSGQNINDLVRRPFTRRVDEVLHEINSLTGFRPVVRTITTAPIIFTTNFNWSTTGNATKNIISGAKLYNGTYLWRITTGETLATAFIDNSTGLTYGLSGEAGIWIKTATDNIPNYSVITT